MELYIDEELTRKSTRVLVIDCNRFELTTLSGALKIHGVDIVGESYDSKSAIQLFKTMKPDVVIVSIQGCDDSIINAAQHFRHLDPRVGIVLLSPSPDLRLFGFSEEDLPSGTQIVQRTALREIDQVTVAIEASLERDVQTSWTFNQVDAGLQSLTDVQVETLRMLAQGYSNGDIAKARYVSEKSVEQTIGRIASHLRITHEKGRNLRVILATEFFKWNGAPKVHPSK
jgi:DNA-binding NarL/FixJ family response regulator